MKPNAILWLFFILLFAGCKDTEVPSFLHIEKVELKVTDDMQGTADHGISDAWVYLNDDFIGVYEVPATVPIIAEGVQKITIIAGIKNNGINSARINYPFYDQYTANLNLVKGDTVDFADDLDNTTISNGYFVPQVTYFGGLEFWNEQFEGTGIQLESTSISDAEMTITNDPDRVFGYNPEQNSNGSGLVVLTNDEPYFEIRSDHEFSPIKGQRVYLELNYKCDCVLQVGVYEKAPTETKVYGKGINRTDKWSKIYIELTGEVAQRANATSYNVFIEGLKGVAQNECEVLIDNVKLIFPE